MHRFGPHNSPQSQVFGITFVFKSEDAILEIVKKNIVFTIDSPHCFANTQASKHNKSNITQSPTTASQNDPKLKTSIFPWTVNKITTKQKKEDTHKLKGIQI